MSNVLSLCGGGTSGYITAIILEKLEDELGSSLDKHFDLICGVSTGAIVGSLIAVGVSASEIKESYKKFYKDVFGGRKNYLKLLFGSLYDNKILSRSIGKLIGDIPLGDCRTKFMCHALKLNKPSSKSKFFKSWESDDAKIKIRDVVTASSCALYTFSPYKIDDEYYYDGGLDMNDPSITSYEEAIKCDMTNIKVMNIQTDLNEGFDKPKFLKGLTFLSPKITKLGVEGDEKSFEYMTKNIIGENYLVLNPECYFPITSNDWDAMEAYAMLTWERREKEILSQF